MLSRKLTKKFKSDFKKIQNNKLLVEEFEKIILMIEKWELLPKKNKDHSLKWIYKWIRECHIKPDLLLIYKKSDDELILFLLRIGSHSELF